MSIFSLEGKSAVVTGGGSGIGQAISVLFAKQGAHVHVLELSEENAAETAKMIKEDGGNVNTYSCNVADQAQVNDVFDAIVAESAKIDILINNAGIAAVGKLTETTSEDMDKIFNVNVKGVYNCSFAAVNKMLKTGGGSIVNMASIASVAGVADRFAYSMSKGAVLTMTYSIAQDYVKDNIRCNCICPARVHTPFVDGYLKNNYPDNTEEMFKKLSEYQPIGRMGKPEEVASMALYLSSDEASFLTANAYNLDGGVVNLT